MPATRQSIYAPSPPSPTLPTQRPLLLYGSFLGGTLATSLALTENYTSRSLPTKIVGLITKNAVFDWTGIVTAPTPPRPSSEDSSSPKDFSEELKCNDGNWDSKTLHTLKNNLFTSPASAFDAFASPALFFRTSGLAIPREWSPSKEDSPSPLLASEYEHEDLWPSEEGDLSPPSAPPSYSSSSSAASSERPSPSRNEPSSNAPTRKADAHSSLGDRMSELSIEQPSRPAHLKYPPAFSTLRIPFSLFLYTPFPTSASSSSSSSSPLRSAKVAERKLTSETRKKKIEKRKKDKSEGTREDGDQEVHDGDEISPASQAQYIAALFRRSVYVHELSDRRKWDEDLDTAAERDARAQVGELRNRGEGAGVREMKEAEVEEGGESGLVARWVDEISS